MGYSPNQKGYTAVPEAPIRGPRARTWRLLMEAANSLIDEGRTPTVAEVANRAQVSRATAYRYFPTRSRLITAVVDTALGPVRSWSSQKRDGRERITELFESTFIRFKEFEPHMRAAAQLALEHQALERAGLLEEEPYRRGHRIRILAHAVEPFAASVPDKAVSRLQRALSILYGIEPHIILKDIWGAKNKEVESIVFWMVGALIDATLKESRSTGAARSTRGNGAAGKAAGGRKAGTTPPARTGGGRGRAGARSSSTHL